MKTTRLATLAARSGQPQPSTTNTSLFKRTSLFTPMAAVAALLALTTPTQAQLIYSQDFSSDDSANWRTNYSAVNGKLNSYVNLNFDYSTIGIPAAPHSTGGNTKGLKLSPDFAASGGLIGGAAVPGVSVTPTNFGISANFDMHVDMWINYNGATNPNTVLTTGGGGSGSTIFYGCGYGTAGTAAQVAGQADSIYVGTCTDNGSSAQMRMYGPSKAASYQNGEYQSTGTLIPGFPGDPFVYNNTNGSRAFANIINGSAPGWTNHFVPTKPPQAQINLYRSQTNIQCFAGLIDFAWHDVEVQKIGNVIVYSIDGRIAATGNAASAGTPVGTNLVFTCWDVNSTLSTDPNFTNLNFVVFANIVVSNYANVVNVTAPIPTTSEATPGSPGQFNLTRSSAGVPLTVNYTLTGTATNGVQYTTLPTSVTFSSTATDTNISVFPIDDGIPNATTTVILTIQPGTGYAGAGSAVVNILDNDTPTVDITASSTAQAYGRYTNSTGPGNNADFISYTLTRRGKLTTGSDLTVNLSYSGSAVGGTDYVQSNSVTIVDGTQTASLTLTPMDNASVTTNRTVTVSVAAGTGYAIGTGPATGKVVSAHYAAASVLLNNDLTSAGDASNWNVLYGTGDPANDAMDFSADFGITLASAAGGISVPPPPGGNANALHLTCNKTAPGAPGAVNAYYTNLFLTGDYAVRFNMNLIEGQTSANSTEGAVFGINHTGSYSNWWYGGGFITNATWSSDGVWYFVCTQPAGTAAGDYQEFTGLGGTNNNAGWTRLTTRAQTAFSQVFKDNPGPFTCLDGFFNQTPGSPANGSPALGYDASTWSDVEIRQQNNLVTMSINHTTIFTYTNTTVWTNGYLMLGYADPFGATVGNAEAGVYYANLKVVDLTPPTVTINSIVISGGNVVIKFTTTSAADTIASFTLQSSGAVNGPYANVSPAASITSLGGNMFQATTPYLGGAAVFYRVFHP